MARTLVAINTTAKLDAVLTTYSTDTLSVEYTLPDTTKCRVVDFADTAAGDADAAAASRALNGTLFRTNWAAREFARHKVTASV